MQTEGVQTMTIDTWVALATLVTLFTGFYGLSRRDSTRLREELHGEIGALRGELHGEIGALRGELRGEMGGLRMEMRDEFAALRGELRQEVRRLDDKVERLDDRVYGLAVRLQPALDAPAAE
jgi:hypothetical protein